MDYSFMEERRQEIWLKIKVQPGAQKNEILDCHGGELKIKVKGVPEKGKVNRELIKFLAKKLGTAQSKLSIIQGETNRHKKISLPLEKKADIINLIE